VINNISPLKICRTDKNVVLEKWRDVKPTDLKDDTKLKTIKGGIQKIQRRLNKLNYRQLLEKKYDKQNQQGKVAFNGRNPSKQESAASHGGPMKGGVE
jgi:hypothetical protein